MAARVFAMGALVACSRGEPPTWDAAPGALSVAPLPQGVAPASAAASGAALAGGEDAGAVDPATLPQTRDRPASGGAAFDARAALLFDAIVKDDPDVAMAAFFPLGAYEQVKAVGHPEADWKRRLVANFGKDVHRLHARLGAHAAAARLIGLEVPNERARWIDPGEESNKIGYWRVYGTKLRYDADGSPAWFDVSSLISWRGEWYVVHLSSFK